MTINGITYEVFSEMKMLIMVTPAGNGHGQAIRLDELKFEPNVLPMNDICESLKITTNEGLVIFDHKRSDFIKNGRELSELEEYDKLAYELAHAHKTI